MPNERLEVTFDEAAREINELQRSAGLHFVVRLGEILVRHFFDGDAQLLRRHGPKRLSLSMLSKRPDISLSVTALSEAAGVYEIARRHGDFLTCENLTKSHVRSVLPLAAPDQDRLLELAEAEDWSVERLRDAVRALRGDAPGGSGRPPAHPLLRAVKGVDRMMASLEAIGALPDLHDLDVATLHETEQHLAAAEAKLGALLQEVRGALTLPTPPPPVRPAIPDKGDVPAPDRPTGPVPRDPRRRG